MNGNEWSEFLSYNSDKNSLAEWRSSVGCEPEDSSVLSVWWFTSHPKGIEKR